MTISSTTRLFERRWESVEGAKVRAAQSTTEPARHCNPQGYAAFRVTPLWRSGFSCLLSPRTVIRGHAIRPRKPQAQLRLMLVKLVARTRTAHQEAARESVSRPLVSVEAFFCSSTGSICVLTESPCMGGPGRAGFSALSSVFLSAIRLARLSAADGQPRPCTIL